MVDGFAQLCLYTHIKWERRKEKRKKEKGEISKGCAYWTHSGCMTDGGLVGGVPQTHSWTTNTSPTCPTSSRGNRASTHHTNYAFLIGIRITAPIVNCWLISP